MFKREVTISDYNICYDGIMLIVGQGSFVHVAGEGVTQRASKAVFRVFLLVVLLIPLFRPRYVQQAFGDEGMLFFRCWLLISAVISTVALIKKRRGMGAYPAAVGALLAIVLLSTIINHGSKMVWIDNWLGCWIAIALVFAFRDEVYDFLVAVLIISLPLSLADFLSMLLFPEGIFSPSVYFYGNRNAAFQVFLPALLSSLLLGMHRHKVFYALAFLAGFAACGQLVCGGSRTSMLVLTLTAVVLVLGLLRPVRSAVNVGSGIAASVLGSVLIVGMRVQDWFAPFIVNTLGKTVTLSGRTEVWDKLFSLTDVSHVALGWGLSGHELLVVNGVHYYFAHNAYLEFWLDSGLVGLFLFVLILGLAAHSSWRYRGEPQAFVLAVFLGAYLLIGITETMVGPSFFLVLALAYGTKWFDAKDKRPFSLTGLR